MSSLDNNYNQFLADFILQCVNDGKNSVLEICDCAEHELSNIENELKRIEQLKNNQAKLNNVIRQLKGYNIKDNIKNNDAVISSLNTNSIVPNMSELCVKICERLENNSITSPNDLMNSISSIEDNFYVYSAIKFLTDTGIIKRSGEDRSIITGDNWESRPKRYENNI
jgi:hypothetical protein